VTIIDAHLHVWDLERAEYPWLDSAVTPIDRTTSLDEVLPEMADAGVARAILVQAADDPADTAHMLEVADNHPEVAGVVAWLPLDDPEQAAMELDRVRADPRVVGVRTLIHDRRDPDWILSVGVGESLELLATAGIPYDFVTSGPAALAQLPVLAERHPDLHIVLDHLGKPPLGGSPEQLGQWGRLLELVAENPRLSAKVSGLYAAGPDPAAWTADQVARVIDIALDVFGADRLMYGSDWPISVLAGGYRRVWSTLSACFDSLNPIDRDAVLGGTARRVYNLPGSGVRPGGA
jgi:L-fuconolactonase